jgi:hypothetical protein
MEQAPNILAALRGWQMNFNVFRRNNSSRNWADAGGSPDQISGRNQANVTRGARSTRRFSDSASRSSFDCRGSLPIIRNRAPSAVEASDAVGARVGEGPLQAEQFV